MTVVRNSWSARLARLVREGDVNALAQYAGHLERVIANALTDLNTETE